MKDEKTVRKLVEEYKDVVSLVRLKRATREEAGEIFRKLVNVSGLRRELYQEGGFGRSSLDRYIKGSALPQEERIILLERFFLERNQPNDGISYEELVSPEFRPLIAVIDAYNNENSDSLAPERVADLVTVMRGSYGTFTRDVILAFLNIKLCS